MIAPPCFSLQGKRVLLIIGGGISAYKSLTLIRRLRSDGAQIQVVLTKSAKKFVTPLSVGALCGNEVYMDLFDSDDGMHINHIRLARDSDVIIIAPASANLLARTSLGMADDLATALLLAAPCPILAAPAMNTRMWQNPATVSNVERLQKNGVVFIGPREGLLAEGEYGVGCMEEPENILIAARSVFGPHSGQLSGKRAIVTSGPTHEKIDPLRYISNRSSGKQGHCIAMALAAHGAKVTLISGPVSIPDPAGVHVVRVKTARSMLEAVENYRPTDIFISAAAVSDWCVRDVSLQKIKKSNHETTHLELVKTPDILAIVSIEWVPRPALVVGFAAETERLIEYARQKLARKGCDWILANDVSEDNDAVFKGVMGADENIVNFITADAVENWPRMNKSQVAWQLAEKIVASFASVEDAR